MSDSSYVFVLSRIDVDAELPFEIVPDHFLRKATDEEIVRIKQLIRQVRPIDITWYPYERTGQQRLPGEKDGSYTIHTEELPESDWAYWVVSFVGTNEKIKNLRYACSLLKNEIELGFVVQYISELGRKAVSIGGHSEFSFFSQYNFGTAPSFVIGAEELQEIAQNYELIVRLSEEYIYIERALKWFVDLRKLPRKSELLTVGLFTIIETLITHNPSGSGSSLTHQLSTKIPLLNSRFRWGLDYSQYFDMANEANYWKKLYAFRSQVVHNGKIDIDGELAVLRNKENVTNCLTETVKLLLLLALTDPIFLTNLKKC